MTNRKRPIQFTLRTLFLITAAVAAMLGAVCWLGPEVIPFEIAAVGAWVGWKAKPRHLLVWLVPALWAACAVGSWRYPGEEVLFTLSILPSLWLFVLVPLLPFRFIHLCLIAGFVPMAGVGWLLDQLRSFRWLWAILYVGATIGVLIWPHSPLLRLAVTEDGSLWPYVFAAANGGMYLSILPFAVGAMIPGFRRPLRHVRAKAGHAANRKGGSQQAQPTTTETGSNTGPRRS